MFRRVLILAFVLIIASPFLQAQDMLGLANSNYAGTNGWKLNPANLADSRLKWDVNIVGVDVFAKNSYVYAPNGSFTLIRLVDGSQSDLVAKDKYDEPPKYAYLTSNISLPSFMISLKNQTFGFHINERTMVNAVAVPFHIAKFYYEGLDFSPQHHIDYQSSSFSIAAMSWLEYGLSYSGAIVDYNRTFVSAGANFNFLKALAGGYFINRDLQYSVPNADTVYVKNINADLASAYTSSEPGKLFAGTGTGVDLGIVIERKREYSWTSFYRRNLIKLYDYRFGVSLIDFGKVNFNNNAILLKVNDKADTLPIERISSTKGASELGGNMNEDFNKSTSVPVGSFKMSMPTALSIQYDRNLSDYWYFNTTLIYNLTNYGVNLTRMKELSVALRYESKWLEVGIPLTLYNIEKPMVGFAFRLHSFYIGSDNILPLMGVGRIYGANFYVGFKVSAFKERWTIRDKSAYLNSFGGIFRPFWRK